MSKLLNYRFVALTLLIVLFSQLRAQNYSRLKIVGAINVFIESTPESVPNLQYDTVGNYSAEIQEHTGYTSIRVKPVQVLKTKTNREIELQILSNFIDIADENQQKRVNVYLVTNEPIKLIKALKGAKVTIKNLKSDDFVMHLKSGSAALIHYIDVEKMVLNTIASEMVIRNGRANSQMLSVTRASRGNFRLRGESAKINVSDASELRYLGIDTINSIQINVANGSNLIAKTNAKEMRLKSSAKSDVGLKGRAVKSEFFITHKSTLIANQFLSDIVKIISQNHSEVFVHPLNNLIGSSINNSNIYYTGNPKLVAVKTKVDSRISRRD